MLVPIDLLQALSRRPGLVISLLRCNRKNPDSANDLAEESFDDHVRFTLDVLLPLLKRDGAERARCLSHTRSPIALTNGRLRYVIITAEEKADQELWSYLWMK